MLFKTKHNTVREYTVVCVGVLLLSEKTNTTPTAYRLIAVTKDSNDKQSTIGHNVGDILYDNIGTPFLIYAVNGNIIDVYDCFDLGECPVNGEFGVICMPAWNGRANVLSGHSLQKLHQVAKDRINQFNLDILWSNDPNPKRVTVTNTTEPQITNYQEDQLDGFNLAEDYGENPKIRLMQIDELGNILERTERPYMELIDGLINKIHFGTLPDTMTGYIEISR